MDRTEFAATLQTWRARLQPHDVGLPAGGRRRTPGLRREEVAGLAGISVDYLVRLEQARGPHPSDAVLVALARALRLTDDERDHLFHLAGLAPPRPGRLAPGPKPSTLRLLDRFTDLPAMLLDAKGEVLAWNPLAAALLGDFSAVSGGRRNVLWQVFVEGSERIVATPEEAEDMVAMHVANLQAAAARYPEDPGIARLVGELRRHSSEFERLWQRRHPAEHRGMRKRIRHPEIGELVLDCDVLHVPDVDQALVVFSAAPGSPDAEKLALLRVLGVQRLDTAPAAEGDW
jgi:transcriptional regulator with XRE-family HTH domain